MRDNIGIDRDRAAEIFLRKLVHLAYRGGIEVTLLHLEEGIAPAPLDTPFLQWIEKLHQWYTQLAEEDKQMVQDVLMLCADAVLFRLCCYLDRVTGGPSLEDFAEELEGYYSDFVVYLQVYSDFEDYLGNRPMAQVWVKPDREADLHDQLDWTLEDFHREHGWKPWPVNY